MKTDFNDDSRRVFANKRGKTSRCGENRSICGYALQINTRYYDRRFYEAAASFYPTYLRV